MILDRQFLFAGCTMGHYTKITSGDLRCRSAFSFQTCVVVSRHGRNLTLAYSLQLRSIPRTGSRAIQGLGGGLILSLVQIIVADITTIRQRGAWSSFIGATWGIA